ncbi:MAG: isoprenylcysteine carboxylmethyltransferase family protein [Bacteroidota bacterium]
MALQEELKKQGDYLFKFRSYLPLLLLIVGVWIKVYQEAFSNGANETIVAEILEELGILVGITGLIVRIWTVGYTPKNTSGRNTKDGQLADVLNTTGLYSIIRNPLYLGNYLMWVGIAMITGNIWFVLLFTLVFWIYYERIIYAEESFLRKKFGDLYLDWASKTPAFLPKHLNYIKPDIQFSWKKVLKKEKNGLFALFLLFSLFGLIGDLAEGEFSLVEERLSIFGAILTGIIYFILKYLKKRTSILNETGR